MRTVTSLHTLRRLWLGCSPHHRSVCQDSPVHAVLTPEASCWPALVLPAGHGVHSWLTTFWFIMHIVAARHSAQTHECPPQGFDLLHQHRVCGGALFCCVFTLCRKYGSIVTIVFFEFGAGWANGGWFVAGLGNRTMLTKVTVWDMWNPIGLV